MYVGGSDGMGHGILLRPCLVSSIHSFHALGVYADPKYVFRAKDHLLFIEAMNIYGEDFWLISHHMGLGPTGQGLVAMYARKMHNLVGNAKGGRSIACLVPPMISML